MKKLLFAAFPIAAIAVLAFRPPADPLPIGSPIPNPEIKMKDISGAKFDSEKVDLLLNVVHPAENRDVPDPWYGPEQGYYLVFDLVEEACEILIKKLQASL